MRRFHVRDRWILSALWLAMVGKLFLAPAVAGEPARVLVLHSYHQGFAWTDGVQRGIDRVFSESGLPVVVSVEYLDSKRHAGDPLFPILADFFAVKYARWRPDILLSCDDDALSFLFLYRNRRFPGAPVVFCGLNMEAYDPELLEGRKGYTGVVERLDLASTIALIPRMQPEVTRVAFVHDRTTAGLANRRTVEELAPRFADRLAFVYPHRAPFAEAPIDSEVERGVSEGELLAYLESLTPDTAVVFLGFYRDRLDAPLEMEGILPKICTAAPVPVYGCMEDQLGHGIVGGKLLSGEVHGRSAARKAVRILRGEAAAEIPVTVESSNRYMFDDRQLRRFQISAVRLPENRILVHAPESFVQRHGVVIGWSLAGAGFLIAILLLLFVSASRRLRAERALAASERKYRLLADHSADVIWTMDADHQLTYISPAIEKLSGYTAEEFLKLSFEQWMTPQSLESARRGIAERRRNWDRVNRFEQEMIRKNGAVICTEVIARGLRDECGRPFGLVGATRDITERRRAEAALRESERRYREMYNRTPAMLHSIDDQGRLVSVSDYWLHVMGYDRDDVLGRLSTDFLAEASRRLALEEYIPRFMETGEAWDVSYQFVTRAGKVLDVLMSAISETDASGRFVRSLAVLRDVTARKRAEAAVQESEERLRLVLEGSGLGFWDWDIPKNEVRRNERWAEILDYSLGEINFSVSQWRDLIHPDDREKAFQSVQDHLAGGSPLHEMEYRMIAKNGDIRWVLDRARVVRRDDRGNPVRMCGTHADITERKAREAWDRHRERRVQRARRYQSLTTMAGAVAHNFNNLLMTILGNLDMALSDISRLDPARELIASAHQSAMRAAELSRLMLLYVGQGQKKGETFCLLEMIREQKASLRKLAPPGIRIRFPPDREGTPCWIRGDRTRLGEALGNLVANGIEAVGAASGEVVIGLKEQYSTAPELEENYGLEPPEAGWFVGLSVRDTGCGMTDETRRRLFEPYFTTHFTGRGLGLAVVLGIVRGHGGAIQVQSAPGEGAQVTLLFPSLEMAEKPESGEAKAADMGATAPTDRAGNRAGGDLVEE